MDRIADYVDFHNRSFRSDDVTLVLKKYCEMKRYGIVDLERACAFYSLTYSVASTVVLMQKIDELINDPDGFWIRNKNKLVFQSDRKYVKMNDTFIGSCLDLFEKNVFGYLYSQDVIDVEKSVKYIEGVKYFGRVSAFLLIETYCCLFDKKCCNNKLDWKNGSTVTSGILNVLGRDYEAEIWDREHNLKIDCDELDRVANKLLELVSFDKELPILESNLCAYRKLFKQSRYLGYYSDRCLEEIYKVFQYYPEYEEEKRLIFLAREQSVDSEFLGEKNGWSGIRPWLKKFYVKTGKWDWTSSESLF